MRILLYSRAFPPGVGGMERFAEELADWLTARGHDVTVATSSPAGMCHDGNRPYRVLRSPDFTSLRRAARWANAVHVNGLSLRGILVALGAGRRPVVTHTGHQAICATGLAWTPGEGCQAGAGRIGPCFGCPASWPVGTASVRLHRLGAKAATANVCVSRYLAARLALAKSVTIYNLVRNIAFVADSTGQGKDGLIAFAGRLVAEKGLDTLLATLTQIPEATLEVGGDGPMRRTWEDLARSLNVASRVRFLGALDFSGVMSLYARACVVCVPSAYGEPFGYSAAEAMAMGRPVVVTPMGALPELVEGGRGFVAPSSTPAALAAVLSRAVRDPEGRRRAGEQAREFAFRELSPDVVGPKYLKTYEEAAG